MAPPVEGAIQLGPPKSKDLWKQKNAKSWFVSTPFFAESSFLLNLPTKKNEKKKAVPLG